MIQFEQVTKIYSGHRPAVADLNLTIESGSFVALIGTSGSGKTTCMRMINRMIDPTRGRILIDGQDIAQMPAVRLRRKIGYVIQQIGLMPHMTIFDNIVTVPKLLKWSRERQQAVAETLIRRVDLPDTVLGRYPGELSGGQQQRIGVIRALAADQDIILMDEPFGALDPITRDSLQHLIKRLQQEMGKTVVFVTHDMDEALSLADRIAIMDGGRLVQYDTPDRILAAPANDFVENMLGEERLRYARSATTTVEQMMMRTPATTTVDQTTREALAIMRDKRVDSLFVTDASGVIQGVVDVFDIDRLGRHNLPLTDVMKECVYIREDTRVMDAVYSILKLGYRNLPVVDGQQRLTGLVTRAAIVSNIYSTLWESDDRVNRSLETIVGTTAEKDEVPPELEAAIRQEAAEQMQTAGGDEPC